MSEYAVIVDPRLSSQATSNNTQIHYVVAIQLCRLTPSAVTRLMPRPVSKCLATIRMSLLAKFFTLSRAPITVPDASAPMR